MRRENKRKIAAAEIAQRLHNLRMMAMTGDGVSAKILGDLGVKQALVGALAGAGDAGFGVGDNDGVGAQQAFFDQRQKPQFDGGRVAAGAGDELRFGDLGAVGFDQAINGARQKMRRGVRFVMAGENGGVAQAEIRRQIENDKAAIEQRRRFAHRDSVRGGEKGGVDAARPIALRGRKQNLAGARRSRLPHDIGKFLSGAGARDDGC